MRTKTYFRERISMTLVMVLITVQMSVMGGPTTVYAADNDEETKTIADIGADIISDPIKPTAVNAKWQGNYVYYGTYNGQPVKYRVLDSNTQDYSAEDEQGEKAETMLLDCDSVLDKTSFGSTNSWINSSIRTYLNGASFLTNKQVFSTLEEAAITKSYKDSAFSEDGAGWGTCNYVALAGEKIFLLDAKEATNETYGYSSVGHTGEVVANKVKVYSNTNSSWWLRSYYKYSSTQAVSVYDDGDVYVNYSSDSHGVSPAFNVDLSSILFVSTVNNTVGETGAEYKLTLRDSNMTVARNGNIQRSEENAEATITVPCTITGTNAGNASQISILITDKEYTDSDAQIIEYTKLTVDQGEWQTGEDGIDVKGTFILPEQCFAQISGKDYHVYIVADDVNGSNETDYASEPVEITLPNMLTNEIKVSGIEQPVVGQTLDSECVIECKAGESQNVTIDWTKNGNGVTGTANYKTVYTASVTVKPGATYSFSSKTKVFLDGVEVAGDFDEDSGNIVITKTFDVTDAKELANEYYITQDDLINCFDLDGINDKTGKVYFGKNESDKQVWYIAGSDADNSIVLLCDPRQPMMKSDYSLNSESTLYNLYTETQLRSTLNGFTNGTENERFTVDEQRLMSSTAMGYEMYGSSTQTMVSEPFYLPYGKSGNNYISVGENNSDLLSGDLKIALDNFTGYSQFWLRTPGNNKQSILSAKGKAVVTGTNKNKFSVVPAFRLNLSSVLFASVAEASMEEATFTTNGKLNPMTLRFDAGSGENEKIKSRLSYDEDMITINKEEGDVGDLYLYIQNADSVFSMKITEDKEVTLDSIYGQGNTDDSEDESEDDTSVSGNGVSGNGVSGNGVSGNGVSGNGVSGNDGPENDGSVEEDSSDSDNSSDSDDSENLDNAGSSDGSEDTERGITSFMEADVKIWLEVMENNIAYAYDGHMHEYEDGICTSGNGEHYQPAKLVSETHYPELLDKYNGYYAIENLGQLKWFGESVNTSKAVLTTDLVVGTINEPYLEWKSIGVGYGGLVDGNGHTIEMYINNDVEDAVGFFGTGLNATVQNFVFKGKITCDSTYRVGAVSNAGWGSQFYNIVSYVDITNTGTACTGGIVGYAGKDPSSDNITTELINCAVYADISCYGGCAGGLIGQGWGGWQRYSILNSVYCGNLLGSDSGVTGALVGYSSTGSGAGRVRIENCYYNGVYEGSLAAPIGGWAAQIGTLNAYSVSQEQLESGEVTYSLNASKCYSVYSNGGSDFEWKQTLNTGDASSQYPQLAGKSVYQCSSVCGYANHICSHANSFVWSGTECQFAPVCTNEANEECSVTGYQCTVTSEVTKQPTCTEYGETTYTAVYQTLIGLKEYTSQKIYADVEPIGHNYQPEFSWTEDNECNITLTCKNDESHVINELCDVSSNEISEHTCTENGETKYIATYEHDGVTYTDEKVKDDIAAVGHDYDVEFTWTEDNECTVTLTCKNDESHVMSNMSCSVNSIVSKQPTCSENGITTYTAVYMDGEMEYTDEKSKEDIPALGHEYEKMEFIWSEDGSSCEIVFVCKNDSTHIVRKECSIDVAEITEATCTEMGVTTYKATYLYEGNEYTDTKDVRNIPLISHRGGEATCRKKAICEECSREYGEIDDTNHVETEIRNAKQANCKENGYTGDEYCKACNEKIVSGETIAKTLEHTWDAGKVTKKPTTNEKGIKLYSCIICEATRMEELTVKDEPDNPPEIGTKINDAENKAIYKVLTVGENPTVEFVELTNKKAKEAIIPDTIVVGNITYKVTAIDKSAFAGNKYVKKITIGNHVSAIPANAFKNCVKLTTVKMGNAVKRIGKNAFYGCKKLKSVAIGIKVTTIGDKAFYKCTALTKITIPSKVKKIGKSAFQGCKKLKNIHIKTKKLNNKNVGKNAFKGAGSSNYKKLVIKVPSKKYVEKYKKLLRKKGLSAKAKVRK